MIWNVIRTIAFPRLPLVKGGDFVQDVSGSMSEPDKTYARNNISEESRKNKIAIVLDYELTTFDTNDSYVDKEVGLVANNIYRNQPYVLYTYFKDTKTLVIKTNIDPKKGLSDSEEDKKTAQILVSQKKEDITTDAQLVKEIMYFNNLLNPEMGIRNWNFNLNTEAARNVALASVGSIVFLILGIGVFPNDAWKWPSFNRRTKKQSTHSAE